MQGTPQYLCYHFGYGFESCISKVFSLDGFQESHLGLMYGYYKMVGVKNGDLVGQVLDSYDPFIKSMSEETDDNKMYIIDLIIFGQVVRFHAIKDGEFIQIILLADFSHFLGGGIGYIQPFHSFAD